MKIVSHQHFDGQEIDLTGDTHLLCSFRNCVLTRNKSETAYRPGSCQYVDCRFVGDDWPPEFSAEKAAA